MSPRDSTLTDNKPTGWEMHIPIMIRLWIMNEPQHGLRVIMYKK